MNTYSTITVLGLLACPVLAAQGQNDTPDELGEEICWAIVESWDLGVEDVRGELIAEDGHISTYESELEFPVADGQFNQSEIVYGDIHVRQSWFEYVVDTGERDRMIERFKDLDTAFREIFVETFYYDAPEPADIDGDFHEVAFEFEPDDVVLTFGYAGVDVDYYEVRVKFFFYEEE